MTNRTPQSLHGPYNAILQTPTDRTKKYRLS